MTLADILAAVPVALVTETAELLRLIFASNSPAAALQKAKLAVIADAADAATDAALRKL